MLFETLSGNWQLQLWGADAIAQMRKNGAKDYLDGRFSEVVRVPFNSRYFPVQPAMPAYYIAMAAGALVVVIDGSTTPTQGIRLVEGYGQSTAGSSVVGVNPYLADCANLVLEEINRFPAMGLSSITLFGHSLGGAIALALHGSFTAGARDGIVTTITYGAPRTGTDEFTRRVNLGDIARIMTPLDPVPLVPPQEGQAPIVRLVASSETLVQWNRYVHTNGGSIVTPDARRYDAEYPSDALFRPVATLAAWLATLPTSAQTVHSIDTYVAYIENFGRVNGAAAPITPPATPPERTHTQTMASIKAEKERASVTVYDSSHTQNSLPLRVPQQFLFTARKQGQVWTVFFQQRAVAVGPGRLAARRLASAGNTFASRMLRSGQVDTEAVLSGFLEWFGFAENPASGISPPLVGSAP